MVRGEKAGENITVPILCLTACKPLGTDLYFVDEKPRWGWDGGVSKGDQELLSRAALSRTHASRGLPCRFHVPGLCWEVYRQ